MKRWYFLCLGILLALLILARYTIVVPTAKSAVALQSTANVMDNLIAASVTSVIIGLGYLYLYPEPKQDSFQIVRSRDIAAYISNKTGTAREWSVRSRAANYFTTVTLNDLANAALRDGKSVSVRVQVIDPTNDGLLSGYASAMQDSHKTVATWSTHRAKIEVYASLLRAAFISKQAPRVDISFGLSPHLWVMSLDYSDEFALVTCQRKGDDALAFATSSEFYRGWSDDFESEWSSCRVIRPRLSEEVLVSVQKFRASDYGRIEGFYSDLGLPEPTQEEVSEIIKSLTRGTDYD